MAEDFEIQHNESNEGGEVSAEAVERLAKQLQTGSAQDTQTEAALRKMGARAASVMVRMLKSPGKGTLAKLIARALREGNPACLVTSIASLGFQDINAEMPRENVLIYAKGTWPVEHRERLEDWERIMVASLEHCVEGFRKNIEKTNGELPDLAKLMKYVVEKSCHVEGVNGEKLVVGLTALVGK